MYNIKPSYIIFFRPSKKYLKTKTVWNKKQKNLKNSSVSQYNDYSIPFLAFKIFFDELCSMIVCSLQLVYAFILVTDVYALVE